MGKQSLQKAKHVKLENVVSKNGHQMKKLTYIWLKDDGTEKEVSVQFMGKYLKDEQTIQILQNLKDGSEYVVVKEEEGQYWNFKELRDIKTYQAKEVYNGGNKSSDTRQSSGKSSYDPYGATIGMMFNNAVLISLNEGLLSPEERENQILTNAKELVNLVQKFEQYARPLLDKRVQNNEKNRHEEEDMSMRSTRYQDQYPDNSEVPF